MRFLIVASLVVCFALPVVAEDSAVVRVQKAAVGRYILARENYLLAAADGAMTKKERAKSMKFSDALAVASKGGEKVSFRQYLMDAKRLGRHGGVSLSGTLNFVEPDKKHPLWDFVYKQAFEDDKTYMALKTLEEREIFVCELELDRLGDDAKGIIMSPKK